MECREAFVAWEQDGTKFHADVCFYKNGQTVSKTFNSKAELDAYLAKFQPNAAVLSQTKFANMWVMRSQQGQFPIVYVMFRPDKPGRHEVLVISPVGQFSSNGKFTVTYYIVKGKIPRFYSKIMENIKVKSRRKIVISKIVQGYQNAIASPRYNFAVTKIHMQFDQPEGFCYLTHDQAKEMQDKMLAENPPRCSLIQPDERAAEGVDAWCLRSLDCDVLKLLDELGGLEENKRLTREKLLAIKNQPSMEEYLTRKKYRPRKVMGITELKMAKQKHKFLMRNKCVGDCTHCTGKAKLKAKLNRAVATVASPFAFVQTGTEGNLITGYFFNTQTGKAVPVDGHLDQKTNIDLLNTKKVNVITPAEARRYKARLERKERRVEPKRPAPSIEKPKIVQPVPSIEKPKIAIPDEPKIVDVVPRIEPSLPPEKKKEIEEIVEEVEKISAKIFDEYGVEMLDELFAFSKDELKKQGMSIYSFNLEEIGNPLYNILFKSFKKATAARLGSNIFIPDKVWTYLEPFFYKYYLHLVSPDKYKSEVLPSISFDLDKFSQDMVKLQNQGKIKSRWIDRPLRETFAAIAKSPYEYSISLDFEDPSELPERIFMERGSEGSVQYNSDFEFHIHTHPPVYSRISTENFPSPADLRVMSAVNRPDYLAYTSKDGQTHFIEYRKMKNVPRMTARQYNDIDNYLDFLTSEAVTNGDLIKGEGFVSLEARDKYFLKYKKYLNKLGYDITSTDLIFAYGDIDQKDERVLRFTRYNLFAKKLEKNIIDNPILNTNGVRHIISEENLTFYIDISEKTDLSSIENEMKKLAKTFGLDYTPMPKEERDTTLYFKLVRQDGKPFHKKQSGESEALEEKQYTKTLNLSPRASKARFLHLRVRPPGANKWLYFKRLKSGSYNLYLTKQPGTRQFSTLDIGDLEEPGVQGIATVKGFPREIYTKFKDSPVHAREMKIHKILIEQDTIGWHDGLSTEATERLIKTRYGQDVIKALLRDAGLSTANKVMARTCFDINSKAKGRAIDFTIRLTRRA
jgi:hypothetical protein